MNGWFLWIFLDYFHKNVKSNEEINQTNCHLVSVTYWLINLWKFRKPLENNSKFKNVFHDNSTRFILINNLERLCLANYLFNSDRWTHIIMVNLNSERNWNFDWKIHLSGLLIILISKSIDTFLLVMNN